MSITSLLGECYGQTKKAYLQLDMGNKERKTQAIGQHNHDDNKKKVS